MPRDAWLTPAEAAAILGVDVRRVCERVRRGTLRARRKRRNLRTIAHADTPVHHKPRRARILIARADLDRWLASRREVEDLRELAAQLVRNDRLTIGEIAQRVGMWRSTIVRMRARWRAMQRRTR